MSGTDPVSTPEVRDKRVAPSGVLPKNTQAWVLTGLAVLMVVIIALSGHNAPKEKPLRATAPSPVVEPNATQIGEYESQLKEETQKLQTAKEQLARTQLALGVAPGDLGNPPAAVAYPGAGVPRLPARLSSDLGGDESGVHGDRNRREEQSLFASNIALTYRKAASAAQAPTGMDSPPDLTTNGGFPAAPAVDIPAATVTPSAYPPTVGPASAAKKEDTESQNAARRAAERDAALDRSAGNMYRLFEGTILETVLTNRLDGSFSGPVDCLVTADVYSHNGQHVLIPQGSRVLGEVRKVETFGDHRLAVVFHRLLMPDGYSVSLDKFHGLNQIGETGLQDQVNHHYLQVFGVSIALGLVAGFSQANTNYGPEESATDAYRQGMASSVSQSSMHILDRYLNVLPTITIREGHRVKVYLSDDLLLPAYEKHQMPNDL
ncbi:MAG TPA: TrbI/VirB10 family protein [Bryobacteraceae bacterium]|jgi:type IV secretion system protein VirB10